MPDAVVHESAVVFSEATTTSGQRIGCARLNAPKSLNALSLNMIRLLDGQLKQWEADPGIACVILHGTGDKAFCAGGDIRSLYRVIKEDRILVDQGAGSANATALAFFSEEYRLDHRIHRYSKPVIAWGSGIVMGGGLGLLVGASHRVVTETSRIAMPEITIGLFPDVGGSWFLRRMPGKTGLFVGLTGAWLNACDAKIAGLGDHFLLAAQFRELCERLIAAQWQFSVTHNRETVTEVLGALAISSATALPESNLQKHGALIDSMCAGSDLAAVVERIQRYGGGDPWLQRAAKTLTAGSPTTMALVWALRERAESLSLADVFRLELIVALQCCAHPNLPEGIRALIIDKDGQPSWTPGQLDEVSSTWLAEHFDEPRWPQGRHPLDDLR